MMKPILFNTEMVKAILDGRKTQTRRVVNKEYLGLADIDGNNIYIEDEDGNHFNTLETTWAKYKVNDILYVREPVKVMSPPVETCRKLTFKYLADNKTTDIYLDDNFDYSKKWIQRCQGVPNGCIKKMTRIFLKVTNVKVEKLSDMKIEDFLDEGVMDKEFVVSSPDNGLNEYYKYLKDIWINIWNSTAKDGYKYEDNPYVFVYEFKRVDNGTK